MEIEKMNFKELKNGFKCGKFKIDFRKSVRAYATQLKNYYSYGVLESRIGNHTMIVFDRQKDIVLFKYHNHNIITKIGNNIFVCDYGYVNQSTTQAIDSYIRLFGTTYNYYYIDKEFFNDKYDKQAIEELLNFLKNVKE